jgi:NitT/TauT family transport system permease protein
MSEISDSEVRQGVVRAAVTEPEISFSSTAQTDRPAAPRQNILARILRLDAPLQLLVIVVLLALWQVMSGTILPTYVVSSPSQVFTRLVSVLGTGSMWSDIAITAEELLLGYLLGCAAGLVIGLIFGLYRRLSNIMEPILNLGNAIPKIALAPLFVIFLGLGTAPKIVMAAIIVFFVMFYNVLYGVRATPQGLVNVMKVFGASRLEIVRQVMLPSMLRPLFAGLRAGLPFAMIGVVVGEFVASSQGVGYYINSESQSFDSAGTMAGIIIILVMVLIGSTILARVERRMLRWDRTESNSRGGRRRARSATT